MKYIFKALLYSSDDALINRSIDFCQFFQNLALPLFFHSRLSSLEDNKKVLGLHKSPFFDKFNDGQIYIMIT